MRLAGKTALITGAGKGMGKAFSLLFARHGARVAVADIDEENGRAVVDEIRGSGGEAHFVWADVGDVESCRKLAHEAIRLLGHLDILINNAGYIENLTLEEITEQHWERMMNVNLRSVFFLSQAVMGHMMERRSGRIINMASQAGKTGGLNTGAHYAVTKAGVLCLMKSFAKKLSPHGITVNCISPGVADTDLSRSVPGIEHIIKAIPLGRAATPDEVAQAVLFLASDEAGYITGECLDVNGGLLMD